jgi:hypothetical protein
MSKLRAVAKSVGKLSAATAAKIRAKANKALGN